MYAAELKQQKATGNKITAGILKQKNYTGGSNKKLNGTAYAVPFLYGKNGI